MNEPVVNLRCIAAGLHGGVPRYVNEVVSRLPELQRIAPQRGSGAIAHLWEQTVLPARLGRKQLLWSPGNFGPVAHRRQVVSIYDLSPIDHPEWFGGQYRRLFQTVVPLIARRAEHVITISEFSKQRIVEHFGLPEEAVTIAVPGVSDVFSPDLQVARGHDIVVLAGPDPRKNLARILDAFALVTASLPQTRLLVVTGKRATGVFAPTDLEHRPNVVAVVDPSDDELAHLYRTARAVVSVPLYEGFGLPAAEALATRAPVILSDIPAHDHARARSAAVVDPTSTEEIADAMRVEHPVPAGDFAPQSWDDTAAIIDSTLTRFS